MYCHFPAWLSMFSGLHKDYNKRTHTSNSYLSHLLAFTVCTSIHFTLFSHVLLIFPRPVNIKTQITTKENYVSLSGVWGHKKLVSFHYCNTCTLSLFLARSNQEKAMWPIWVKFQKRAQKSILLDKAPWNSLIYFVLCDTWGSASMETLYRRQKVIISRVS